MSISLVPPIPSERIHFAIRALAKTFAYDFCFQKVGERHPDLDVMTEIFSKYSGLPLDDVRARVLAELPQLIERVMGGAPPLKCEILSLEQACAADAPMWRRPAYAISDYLKLYDKLIKPPACPS